MDYLSLLTGIAIGVALGWLAAKFLSKNSGSMEDTELLSKQLSDANNNLIRFQSDNENLNSKSRQLENELNVERNKVVELTANLSSARSNLDNLKIKMDEQKQEVEQLQEKFTKEFKLIANDLLEEKSKKFTEQNKTNLDEILKPLNEKIKDFEKKVENTHIESIKNSSALKEQLTHLKEMHNQMSKDAQNLTKALKGESKTQGDWGEVILESLLEKSGLVKNSQYFVQESFTNQEGRRLQPDIIIKLPEGKNIIVDAKVSLTAYERYCSTDDENLESIALKEHIKAVRERVKELSEKNYAHHYENGGLDFVLLFVPNEPAYLLAVKHDFGLWNEAYSKQIVIVTTSTLLATLRTIANIWRQENLNRDALEIGQKSGEMYDKFKNFVDDLLEVGHKMEASKKSYDAAMNKLVDGRGNLVQRAENIKKLGAKATKTLPDSLLVRALEDDSSLANNIPLPGAS